jgi:hypothetical protein
MAGEQPVLILKGRVFESQRFRLAAIALMIWRPLITETLSMILVRENAEYSARQTDRPRVRIVGKIGNLGLLHGLDPHGPMRKYLGVFVHTLAVLIFNLLELLRCDLFVVGQR